VNATLLRQDGVETSTTDLDTQSSTLTFKPGTIIDFRKLANAIDAAGFTASDMTVWATGRVEVADGQTIFKVGGSDQTFPLTNNELAATLKATQGQEVKVVGKLEFKETPARLLMESFQM
jgi:hypothetical protein